jgi:hypothetical protein
MFFLPEKKLDLRKTPDRSHEPEFIFNMLRRSEVIDSYALFYPATAAQ